MENRKSLRLALRLASAVVLAWCLAGQSRTLQATEGPPTPGTLVLELPFVTQGSDEVSLSCPSGRNRPEYTDEGLLLRVSGRCLDSSSFAAASFFVEGLHVPDGEIRFAFRPREGADRGELRVWFREQGPLTGYSLTLSLATGGMQLRRLTGFPQSGGTSTVLAERAGSSPPFTQSDWSRLAIRLFGPNLWVLLNEEPVLVYADPSFSSGRLWVELLRIGDLDEPSPTVVLIRDFVISALSEPTIGHWPRRVPRGGAEPGAVLLSDPFDDPADGWLPQAAPRPAIEEFGYVGGEYVVGRIDPESLFVPHSAIPGIYSDVSVAVNVRLVGGTEGRYATLSCRENITQDGETDYRLYVHPALGRFKIERSQPGPNVVLVPWQSSPAISRGGASNRVELTCVGSTIQATINGVVVAVTEDSTYSSGRLVLAVGALNPPLPVEARFDNLAVTQR
jgi:hypothetical protein